MAMSGFDLSVTRASVGHVPRVTAMFPLFGESEFRQIHSGEGGRVDSGGSGVTGVPKE